MKIVVNSLLESIVALLNVLIVIGMVWIMFAILGSSLMKDKLGYCSADHIRNFDKYGVSKKACIETFNGDWKVANSNFDNILNGMTTLYVLSTLEGWPNILGNALDANDETIGPIYNSSPMNAAFFIFFILVGKQDS